MARQNYFAEEMKMVQTANDRQSDWDVVENQFTATSRAIDQLTRPLNCFAHFVLYTKHFSNVIFKVENHISYLDIVYTHLKAYGSAFVSYRANLYSAVSSLTSGYVTPKFLTTNRLAEIVQELTVEKVHRGTKSRPAIQVGYGAMYSEVRIVLEVSILASGISVAPGLSMNSISSKISILRATPMYQPNEDGSIASLYQFRYNYLAISTEKSE